MPRGVRNAKPPTVTKEVVNTCDAEESGVVTREDTAVPEAESDPPDCCTQETCDDSVIRTEPEKSPPAKARRAKPSSKPACKRKGHVNAFFLYSKEQRTTFEKPVNVTHMAKVIGERWRALDEEQKTLYKNKALELRKETESQETCDLKQAAHEAGCTTNLSC